MEEPCVACRGHVSESTGFLKVGIQDTTYTAQPPGFPSAKLKNTRSGGAWAMELEDI